MIHVSEAIDDYLNAKRPPRKDHGGLSVSSVANGCPREVWHRLRSGEAKTFDGPTKKKFEFGFAWENIVLAALKDQGFRPQDSGVAIFGPFPGSGAMEARFVESEAYDEAPATYAARNELVGHPDHLVVDPDGNLTVIEVKTTHLFGRPHPELEDLLTKQGQYVLQTVAYAKAYNAKAVLHVIDRSSGIDRDYELDVERFWPLFLARWEKMLPALGDTEPEIDLPAWTRNPKGQSYLCRGCVAKKCPERRV